MIKYLAITVATITLVVSSIVIVRCRHSISNTVPKTTPLKDSVTAIKLDELGLISKDSALDAIASESLRLDRSASPEKIDRISNFLVDHAVNGRGEAARSAAGSLFLLHLKINSRCTENALREVIRLSNDESVRLLCERALQNR